MLKILNPQSPAAKEAIGKFPELDVYYRPEYLRLSELAGEGQGKLAFFEGERGLALYPFLLREAPFSFKGKRYYDIVSPYGYGGPVFEPKDPHLAKEFFDAFRASCRENSIVAEFVRFFHPVLGNHELFPANALVPRGQVVMWDLTKPNEVLQEELSPKVKRNLKTAEKTGVEIVFDQELELMEEFIRLYEATMERRGAEGRYSFGREYFAFVKEELKPFAFLAAAKLQGKVIASALFFASGPFLAYHLAGSDLEFRASCASELLLYRAALWGKARGFQFLNLGGGVGGKEDSLFQFKASFTPSRKSVFLGKVVHNREAYDALAGMRQEVSGKTEDASFFPAYRA
ncbi:peptidoglycan bridge formation glycyltransferase FemA/FemB family protein [Patescibacteria group bacterium]|nr:peptidoglycan bridge formation glycyltransferase FemA/FemB family protein [Patescibacteria group bacterium]